MTRTPLAILATLVIAACTPTGALPATATPTPTPTPSVQPTGATSAPPSRPASTPRPTPTPVAGVGNCPANSPLTVSQFMDADPACFGTADFEIRGWLDHPPAVGFEPPFVEPSWLALPAPDLAALWEGRPTEPDHVCPEKPLSCAWFFPHIDPASGLKLGFPPRPMIVTGHVDDPAAQTCHFIYPDDWTDEPMDDALAVESCRTQFVVVAFRDAP